MIRDAIKNLRDIRLEKEHTKRPSFKITETYPDGTGVGWCDECNYFHVVPPIKISRLQLLHSKLTWPFFRWLAEVTVKK